ncbi:MULTISPECIES: GFA family protein [Sphingobium]|uniref:GFA family protein n=1 Tax=Sphingobium TaxID=165695 RepID=UPI001F1E37BB|nr:GFA family protein [Sphingobium psychrophilum]
MKHEGSCHCGTIRVAIEDDPVDAGECNCSICRRTGALWTYRTPSQVMVTGMGVGYMHPDVVALRYVRRHHPQKPAQSDVRPDGHLFDPALWNGLPRRFIDGASW